VEQNLAWHVGLCRFVIMTSWGGSSVPKHVGVDIYFKWCITECICWMINWLRSSSFITQLTNLWYHFTNLLAQLCNDIKLFKGFFSKNIFSWPTFGSFYIKRLRNSERQTQNLTKIICLYIFYFITIRLCSVMHFMKFCRKKYFCEKL
jgi:hypothetical protein